MLLAPALARADELAAEVADATNVEQLSLDDLLDVEVDVAARLPQRARETPGIVSVITRDEILASGARDLIDVLLLVPGFAPGVDVSGVLNVGVRGQWALEGKMLLLIDGQPMNDLLYSSTQLGNHYPLENLERIEVIRGPGSVVYGGYAELAVIHLITRRDLDGVSATALYGQRGTSLAHAKLGLAFGTSPDELPGLRVAGSLALGAGYAGGTYRDFDGAAYDLSDHAQRPLFAQLSASYRGLAVQGIFDDYTLDTRDGTGPVLAATALQRFRGYYLDARYAWRLAPDLVLTPRFNLVRQTPWEIEDRSSAMYYSKTASRYTGGAELAWDATKHAKLAVGVEAFADRAHVNGTALVGLQTLFGGAREIAYDTIATYAQAVVEHPIANLTVGARYEYHSEVHGSLVPRVALTKVFGRAHAKLLASRAFRAPGIENINLGDIGLDPERTTAYEAEVGYRLTDHVALAANAFDTTIERPIVYAFDRAAMEERYLNADRTGTRGLEVDCAIKYPGGAARASYSFYSAAGKSRVAAYEVPGHDDVLLGFPAHKVALQGSFSVTRKLSIAPSAVLLGDRYAYTAGSAGQPVLGREPATALVNVYGRLRDALIPGLELGAGVFDLGDRRLRYLQPYAGGHAPLPAGGREWVVRAAYERAL